MTPADLTTALCGPNYAPDALAEVQAFEREVLERAALECNTRMQAERIMRDQHRGHDLEMWKAHGDRAQAFSEAADAIRALAARPADITRAKPDERADGLHCVYGTCRGWPVSKQPCHPGCSFQMSAKDFHA